MLLATVPDVSLEQVRVAVRSFDRRTSPVTFASAYHYLNLPIALEPVEANPVDL
ncbi:MAG: hypothetical protein SWY16_23945 [Cyanobacteriota bacterium]|nr:hypothetical protein [Cyanobacteriota bacterium]